MRVIQVMGSRERYQFCQSSLSHDSQVLSAKLDHVSHGIHVVDVGKFSSLMDVRDVKCAL